MLKFNRNYILLIQASDGSTIEIKPPFTIDIDVIRNSYSSANVASIRIYNLSEKTRSQIRKDQSDWGLRRKVILKAGYGNNLSEVLNAYITLAFSERQGVNFITEIQCFDGGYAYVNANIDKTYPSNTTQQAVILDMINSLNTYGVDPGAIGKIEGKLSRANSYSGNTMRILGELTDNSVFIDNNKVFVLGNNECLLGGLEVINAESGLLGTPRREQGFLNISVLFQPSVKIGQRIILESGTANNYNGVYKVVSLHHKGMISETVGGTIITSLGLFYGYENLNPVQEITK